MFDQLEPLVATDQRIDLIQAQDRDFDAGAGQPVEVKGFEGSVRKPVVWRRKHDAGSLERSGILAAPWWVV
ncbi:hypothetical protein D3C71_2167270 [compost metagenome]